MMEKTYSLSQFHPQNNLPYNKSNAASVEIKLYHRFIKLLKNDLRNKKLNYYAIGNELNLNGYGIADVALLELYPIKGKKRREFNRKLITVFELKINDWRKALKQAYRYKYYSNKSIVVMPRKTGAGATKNIKVFKSLNIGLWIYEEDKNVINKIYTPRINKPFSYTAANKAYLTLLSKIRSLRSF